MTAVTPQPITLEKFLKRPETTPASEYIDGAIRQKPMPKGRHSRLQGQLCATVNHVAEAQPMAYAFPELRCSFGGRSVVPDVAIFRWQRIPFTATAEVPDNFDLPPDWTIEILSSDQNPTQVIGNILHCLNHNCRLGWFVDPDDLSILAFLPHQQPLLLRDNESLPILPEIERILTVDQVFGWLKMGAEAIARSRHR